MEQVVVSVFTVMRVSIHIPIVKVTYLATVEKVITSLGSGEFLRTRKNGVQKAFHQICDQLYMHNADHSYLDLHQWGGSLRGNGGHTENFQAVVTIITKVVTPPVKDAMVAKHTWKS